MNLRTLVLLTAAIFGLTAQAVAQSPASQAKVARSTGDVTVTNADGSSGKVTAGMAIAQGATITTGADGDVYIETHTGYVTAIKKNSVVSVDEISVTNEGGTKKENTVLSLKSGNLVAKLDPAKKAVNNYQVRTPKGVAAARGTVFAVTYNGGTYALSVVEGVVTILPTSTGAGVLNSNIGVQVNAGQTSITNNTESQGTVLPSGMVNNSQKGAAVDIRELLAVAVATVAVAAQNNIGGTTAAEAASVAAAVFAAVPAAAEQAGAIIKQSTPAGQDNSAVLNAISNAIPESAKGAFDSGASSGSFTSNSNTTTPDAPKSNTSKSETPAPPQVTTPQPIDPATVSRSGE